MSLLQRQEFVVNCTQEQAFVYLSDLRNELKWNPEFCQSVEKVSDGEIGTGTRFHAQWKGGPMSEIEYTEFDPPHSWRAHSAGSMETKFHCTIEPHPEGATVVSELELIPHGLFKLVFPIFKWLFGKADDIPDKIRGALNEQHGEVQASA